MNVIWLISHGANESLKANLLSVVCGIHAMQSQPFASVRADKVSLGSDQVRRLSWLVGSVPRLRDRLEYDGIVQVESHIVLESSPPPSKHLTFTFRLAQKAHSKQSAQLMLSKSQLEMC